MSIEIPPVRLVASRPEPANLWIRYAPAADRDGERIWTDPVACRLGGRAAWGAGSPRRPQGPPDIVHLTPSGDPDTGAALRDWCRRSEFPYWTHWIVGEPLQEEACGDARAGAGLLADPLRVLLEGDLASLDAIPPAATVIWPVLRGVTDESVLDEGLERLVAVAVTAVVPVALQLDARERRRLLARFGEALFEPLFHGDTTDPRPVAAACARAGLPFLPPRLETPRVASFERQLAAELAAVGEAGLMAGVGEPVAQEFFRAAAWIESERIDMRDLARSDNLGIAPCLTPRVAEVVRELAAGAQRSSRLTQLLQRIGSQAGE